MEVKHGKGIGSIYDDALQIRLDVFITEQNVPQSLEYDDMDDKATHWVGYIDGEPAVTARTLPEKDSIHIQRVATVKEFRKRGYAKELLETILKSDPTKRYYLGAQVTAIPFYEKLGFKVISDVYMDAGIEHRDMELEPK